MNKQLEKLPSTTPILVGAGQTVDLLATENSPMALASRASVAAIADCGGSNVAAHIDTIATMRIFPDTAAMWKNPFGRSNNPPQSIARAIGANPQHRIYCQPGGNEPLSRLIEFSRDIAEGFRSAVLLTGGEAIRNHRSAERSGNSFNWNETFDQPLDDRGYGHFELSDQEIANGLIMPVYHYTLIEQQRLQQLGLNRNAYQEQLGKLLASFNEIATQNPYAQFSGALSADEILSAAPITHLYSKRMIAQDSVNQGAAVLMMSVAKARELGISEDRWIFLHGAAEGNDIPLGNRPNIATSQAAIQTLNHCMATAEKTIDDIEFIDIYSAFPCAITAISDHLDLVNDGSIALTITGGMPYFGGPGSNYSMHALATMLEKLRKKKGSYALVTSNGGVLAKHAMGIFSQQACRADWSHITSKISATQSECREMTSHADQGNILSYSVNYSHGKPSQAIVIAETESGRRFFCCTAPDDQLTIEKLLTTDVEGHAITVTAGEQPHSLHFQLK